jgi:hypothetical protein
MVMARGVGDGARLRSKRGVGGIHDRLNQSVSCVTSVQVPEETGRADVPRRTVQCGAGLVQ